MGRYLKKRELLAFYLLSKRFHGYYLDFDEAVHALQSKFGFSKKVSSNIVKRLIRIGLVKRTVGNKILVLSIDEYLNDLLEEYVIRRRTLIN